MNTPKLLTVDEVEFLVKDEWLTGALCEDSPEAWGRLDQLLYTALAAMECKSALELSRAQWIHSVNAKQCVEALKPFQQIGEDKQK